MFLRVRSIAILASLVLGVSACDLDSGGSKPPPPDGGPTGAPGGQAQVRAVHGSPDAGPVDVYIYATSASLPGSPTISNLRYRAISNYVNVSSGAYNVDIYPQGRRANPVIPTESINVNSGQQVTAAVTGEVAKATIGFTNFVEPAETPGQAALIVHHAAPILTGVANLDPIGVGYYDANVAGGGNPSNGNIPVAAITKELLAFSNLPSPSGAAIASGPAPSGQAPVDGEFFVAPLPANLPTAIGFAAGSPVSDGAPLASIIASALPTQLATNTTLPNSTLQNDTSERLPAGAHLSIFAVDNTTATNGATPPPVTLIGTLDP